MAVPWSVCLWVASEVPNDLLQKEMGQGRREHDRDRRTWDNDVNLGGHGTSCP